MRVYVSYPSGPRLPSQLPPYTCCERPFPSFASSRECGISSLKGSSGDTPVSPHTVRPPSSPVRSDSCRPAPLWHRGDIYSGAVQAPETLRGACEVTYQLLLLLLLLTGCKKKKWIQIYGLPNSRSEKTSAVLSSFRFLLNSMESSLISLENLLISFGDESVNSELGRFDRVVKQSGLIHFVNY